ncbi:hypothetical protein [Eleftheria terrae]|uniref:hypothetical protein n=1 Tax=Eleftheria terrae TaxID=1597781 RepID=UPI00263B8440|nr:hypothetical protein [Eleftheria terrae]WKB55833.1 hypothetical protein N7L95_27525 [Eleftheria terrae]
MHTARSRSPGENLFGFCMLLDIQDFENVHMYQVLYRVIAKITRDAGRSDYWLSPAATGIANEHRFGDGRMSRVGVRFPRGSDSIRIGAGTSCDVLAIITRWDDEEPVREGDTWEIAMHGRVEAHGQVISVEEVAMSIDSYPTGDNWRDFMGV